LRIAYRSHHSTADSNQSLSGSTRTCRGAGSLRPISARLQRSGCGLDYNARA
jgi:hypothetical protein